MRPCYATIINMTQLLPSELYPDILTYADVAKVLRVSITTVKRMIARSDYPLPVFYLSKGTPRIYKHKLIEWLKGQEDPRQDV